MYGANLDGVLLKNANLTAASLTHSNLTAADLTECVLTGAKLSDADFFGARLDRAKLANVLAFRARFLLASLTGADFSGANLVRAVFTGADLSSANFSGAQLRFAGFVQARFWRTNLAFADCRDAHILDVQLRSGLNWVRRLSLADWVNWQTVRALGSLQVLTKVSYLMLALVPLLAGLWLAVRSWIEPAGLDARMPSPWAHGFFAALCAAGGHLVYQIWSPDTTKEATAEQFVERIVSGFSADAPNRDDRLARALTSLRELADRSPELRNANLVLRHGAVCWIPSKAEHLRAYMEGDDDDPNAQDYEGNFEPARMLVAVEEGARAEYALRARDNKAGAATALMLYFAAVCLVGWIVARQSWSVAKAVGWLE